MLILGISDGHDAGACLLDSGVILAAVNEERLSRKKLHCGFPALSIKQCLRISGRKPEEITHVAIASKVYVREEEDRKFDYKSLDFIQKIIFWLSHFKLLKILFHPKIVKSVLKILVRFQRERLPKIQANLKKLGISTTNIEVIEHHLCHACSAYYTSGFSKALVVTLDASGDSSCSQAYMVSDNKFVKLRDVNWIHSPAYYYCAATVLLGFKMGREGKLTGLAAYGNSDISLGEFRKRVDYIHRLKRFNNYGGYVSNEIVHLRKRFNKLKMSHKDIAAGIQKHFENMVIGYLSDILCEVKEEKINICLAGGAFANVKLNQYVGDLEKVDKVFVHPHMGDGGLSVGAAYALMSSLKKGDFKTPFLGNVYLGSEYSTDEIKEVLETYNLKYSYFDDIESEIARLLFEGNLVARFNGRMEYGPRALGNRSLLYKADDVTVNHWLNKLLDRTEYMPFAPAVLEEKLYDFFNLNKSLDIAANFMTTTCNVTEKCKDLAPAVVHVDGTARPQIVRLKSNQSFYKVLKKYDELSGVPVLINTSFNMHEEPIVESPKSAVDAFLRMGRGFLAIGNFIVSSNE